jgi:signal transduction histidine kinase
MHHRAQSLGGTLEVRSVPGSGTVVHASLPWELA